MSRFHHGHSYPVPLTLNHAPTDIALSGAHNVTENALPGTVIGAFTATDQDTGDSFHLCADRHDGRPFRHLRQPAGHRPQSNIDYESLTTPQYDLEVTVHDALGASFTKTFTIFVLDGPEAPYDIELSNVHLYENTATLTNIVQIFGFDPDSGDSLTFSITADPDDKFQISGGDWLQLKNALNYETKTSHSLTLRATDSTGLVYDKSFVFDVINVNENPTSLSLSNTNVAGGSGDGTFVGFLSATDPDLGQTFTFTVTSDPDAKFQVANGNELRLRATVDSAVSATETVQITVADQGGLTFSQSFTINVGPTRHAPTDITITNLSVAENVPAGSLVGSLGSTDIDVGDTFTYSIITDTNNMFTISGNSLLTKNQPQWSLALHPSGVPVTIRTTDSDGFTFDKTFTVSMSAVNHAPTAITTSPSGLIVREDTGVGSTICTLTVTDPDAGDTVAWSKTADPDGKFALVGNALKLNAPLDYSVKTAHTCDITATDSGGLTFTRTLTITVGQVYFAPTDISISNSTIPESAAPGTLVGNLTVADADSSVDALSISSDPDSKFAIANGNQLVVRTGASFDWTVKTSHQVTVLATDPTRGSFAKTFTIAVSSSLFRADRHHFVDQCGGGRYGGRRRLRQHHGRRPGLVGRHADHHRRSGCEVPDHQRQPAGAGGSRRLRHQDLALGDPEGHRSGARQLLQDLHHQRDARQQGSNRHRPVGHPCGAGELRRRHLRRQSVDDRSGCRRHVHLCDPDRHERDVPAVGQHPANPQSGQLEL
jgi:hypothetical protein